MLLLRLSGQLLLRFAERQFWALLFQLPPRFTRFEPGRSSPLRCGEPRSPQDQSKIMGLPPAHAKTVAKNGTASGARKDLERCTQSQIAPEAVPIFCGQSVKNRKKRDSSRRTQRLGALYTIPNRAGGCPNFLRAYWARPKKRLYLPTEIVKSQALYVIPNRAGGCPNFLRA